MFRAFLVIFAIIFNIVCSNEVEALYDFGSKSETTHPIDKDLSTCIEKNATSDGMNSCTQIAYEQWDLELNDNYKLLMAMLVGEEKQDLKKAQINWIQFRDAETQFRMDTFLNNQGSMYSNMAMAEKVAIVSERAEELGRLYQTLRASRE